MTFEEFIRDPYSDKCYLVEMTVFDRLINAEKTLYFCSRPSGFVTTPTDTPKNTYFEPRLIIPLIFSQSLYENGKFGGVSLPGYGAMTLNNEDGQLDSFVDYSVDGRRLVVKIGDYSFGYSQYGVVFDGTMDSVQFSLDSLTIKVRDLQHLLTKPLTKDLYLGTGGWNGTSEMKGVPKPHSYGRCRNIKPVCTDPQNLRYQVHFRSVEAIDKVRDMGVPLSYAGDFSTLTLLDSASILAGSYATCLSEGCFRLASSPIGEVTVDVLGDNVGGAAHTASDVSLRISQISGITAYDSSSFTSLNLLNSSTVGFYTSEEITVQNTLDEIVNSIGAWFSFDRSGRITVGRIDTPSGIPVDEYSGNEIISLERLDTAIPYWRIKLGYSPNYNNLNQTELASSFQAGGIYASENGSLTNEYRYVFSDDTSVQVSHLMAEDQVILTRLDLSSDAQAESDRLLEMFKVDRNVYRVKLSIQPLLRKCGDIVNLKYERYNLSSGKLFSIVEMSEDYVSSTVEMVLWG